MSNSEIYNELPFIEDIQGRRLYYKLKLAEEPSSARTLFILHGHANNESPSKFRDNNWNVVCPIDHFGYEKKGSWWLGESGDFFVKNLMEILIQEVKKLTGSDRLYFWGSSMGGYGAILYGLLFGAEAIYANVPQIKLKNSEYTDKGLMKRCLSYILKEDYPHWIDLTSLLANTSKNNYPIFFISQTRFHFANYLKEHIHYFTDACETYGANYSLNIIPKNGHVLYKNVAQSIMYFNEFEQDILEWKILREQLYKRELVSKDEFRNKYIRVTKDINKNVYLKLKVKLFSTSLTGSKDMLLSVKQECFMPGEFKALGLVLSPNPNFEVYRYLNTKPGNYSIVIDLIFPQSDFLEFSIKECYPKGLTIIEELEWELCDL